MGSNKVHDKAGGEIMATLTVYAKESDGRINSESGAYSGARAGTGTLSAWTGNLANVGQYKNGVYACYKYFNQYDTSSIDAGDDIVSAKEEIYNHDDATDTNFTMEVREYDWGTSLETGDWIPGADLGDYTLLSSKAVSPSAGYNEFPDSANFRAAINKTGDTRLVHNSDRHRIGTTPTGREWVQWRTASYTGTDNDPKLIIEHEKPTIDGKAELTGAGDMAVSGAKVTALGKAEFTGSGSIIVLDSFLMRTIYFKKPPIVTIKSPIATHVTVVSPTHSATANITPEPSASTRIERIIQIEEGNATVCQNIADALIAKWGVEQKSVQGVIPLNVSLDFKTKLFINIPQSHISEFLNLQKKAHSILKNETNVVLGDIILDDNELIARILNDYL